MRRACVLVLTAMATCLAGADVTVAASERQPCVSGSGLRMAERYADGRPGSVAFAVLERGRLRAYRGAVAFRSASLIKAMLLVADLRRLDARGRQLSSADRARHRTMIVRSGNRAATATFRLVGAAGLHEVARASRMRHFRNDGYWSGSWVTAADQARFWRGLRGVIPRRHVDYALALFAAIERRQTWGTVRVLRRQDFAVQFKSGWFKRSDGWLVTQGARLQRGHCTLSLAVLTAQQPTMSHGVETMRGIAERLVTPPIANSQKLPGFE